MGGVWSRVQQDNEGFALLGGTCTKPGPDGCKILFQFYLPKPLLAFGPQIHSNYFKSRKTITIKRRIFYVVASNQLDKSGLQFASACGRMMEGVGGTSPVAVVSSISHDGLRVAMAVTP